MLSTPHISLGGFSLGRVFRWIMTLNSISGDFALATATFVTHCGWYKLLAGASPVTVCKFNVLSNSRNLYS